MHHDLQRILISTTMIPILAIFASCGLFDEGEEERVPPRELTTAEKSLVSSDNKFGLNLFRALNENQEDENVFISPLSVSMALGMTLNAAADSTYEAMKNTLELAGLTETEINESYQSLIELLTTLDPKVAFQIANSIWYRQGFSVEQPFLDTNRDYFDAEVRALDFADPQAVDIINDWVDDKTQGKIDEIIQSIDAATIMYLINAIYFKGAWTYEFDKGDTKDQPFNNLDGSISLVPLMTLEGALPILYTESFSAVDIPYGDSLFSMTVFLPNEGTTVNDLILQINQENWDEWTNQFYGQNVRLFLPRFKLEYRESLVDVLADLGMEVAFIPNVADFSRINRAGGLFISDVIHKTFVEVNEEGTEAAAVTAVVIVQTSVGGGSAIFRVDRPFFFAIRERHSGTVLFIGKIVEL